MIGIDGHVSFLPQEKGKSVVSVRRAAARRCRCVGAAACAPVASASGAAGKAGCKSALSLSGGGLEREGCIQAASDEGSGTFLSREGPSCSGCACWPWTACLASQRGSSLLMPLCSSPYADAEMVGLMGLTASC